MALSKIQETGLGASEVQSVRQALAATSTRSPRPVTDIELPLKLQRLLTPRVLKGLKAAAVLVPLIDRGADGWTVLFTVRSKALRAHGGQISFPGGRRDPGDRSIEAAALREAQEEVGIPPPAVEVVGYLDDYPTVTGFIVTPVVGLVKGVDALVPCEQEVAEVFEVPLSFILDAANYHRRTFARGRLKIPYLELHHGGFRIWGATAGMLWNLVQKLQVPEA